MSTTKVTPGLADADGRPAEALPTTADEVRSYVRRNGVEYVFAQFVDMHGKPCAKLVPTTHLDGLFEDGAGFAGFAAGAIGQRPNDPDIAAIPTPRRSRRCPGARRSRASPAT